MTPDRWRHVEALFGAAADLPPAARAALLDRQAVTPEGAPDPVLREEVERLLALDDGADRFVEALRGGVGVDRDPSPPGAGPWRLVERVGEGGMGEVWRAERADGAYAQTAAVKLVRPGLASDLLARFRAERHLLARLDHPAVARLLDGGTASDGRPYLALEFVAGEPITTYCDQRRLAVDERLALVAEACRAVAAAHRQLVVHRDLKPSNVLVAETPDGPRVKLLDFGIAQLLDDPDGDGPGFTVPVTAAERRVMTPEYAAPEQVRGEPATTATDVYGLGVLLYELLTGARPHPPQARTRRALEDAVLHQSPPPPSAAVSAEAARDRATELPRLRRRLRGDLDRIVLQALRKEPARRYESVSALAADLERHRAGLPVEARSESAAYRVGKFVRRHRAGVAGVALALATLVTSGTLYTVRLGAARDLAQQRTAEAEAVSQFLFSVLMEGDPQAAEPRRVAETTAVLAVARDRLDRSFDAPPQVRADLYAALGTVSVRAHRLAEAAPLLHRARAAYRALGDTLSYPYNDLAFRLGDLHRNRGDLDSARVYYRRAIAGAEAIGTLDGHEAWSYLWLATMTPDETRHALLARAESIAAAIEPTSQPVEARRFYLTDGRPRAQAKAYRQVRLPLAYARHAEAPRAERIAAARRARRQAEHEGFADLAAYATFAEAEARWPDAPEAAHRLAERARRETARVLGADHARVAVMTRGLAQIALARGRPDEAVRYAEQALRDFRRTYGDAPSLEVADAAAMAARARRAAGQPAGDLLRQAAEAYRVLVVPGDPRLAEVDALRSSTPRHAARET